MYNAVKLALSACFFLFYRMAVHSYLLSSECWTFINKVRCPVYIGAICMRNF